MSRPKSSHKSPLISSKVSLGTAIKAAREQQGLSVRELARRAGIPASQLSRIELGQTSRPAANAVTAIARALGRMSLPLTVLASPGLGGAEELLLATESERQVVEQKIGRWSREQVDALHELLIAGTDPARLRSELRAFARDLFLHVGISDRLDDSGFAYDLNPDEVAPLLEAWVSLTDERKKLLTAYAAEQAALSGLDRLGSNPQRYVLADVRLEERDK